jgi:hypothetical protein
MAAESPSILDAICAQTEAEENAKKRETARTIFKREEIIASS